MASAVITGYNTSKDGFVQNVHDDVICLPEDEPILKGKQGKLLIQRVLSTDTYISVSGS